MIVCDVRVCVCFCVCGCERESPRQPMIFKYRHRGCQICLYNTYYPLNWTCPVATFFIYSFVFKTATIKQMQPGVSSVKLADRCMCEITAPAGERSNRRYQAYVMVCWGQTLSISRTLTQGCVSVRPPVYLFFICIFSPVCSKIVNSIKLKKL